MSLDAAQEPLLAPAGPTGDAPAGPTVDGPAWWRLASWWPAVDRPAEAAVAAAVIAGVVAGAAVPWDRPGVGWLAAGVAVAGGVALVGRGAVTPVGWIERLLWTLGALGLLVSTLRASGWLFGFNLLVAAWCAANAVVGGRRLAALLCGGFAVPVAVLRAVPWVGRALRRTGHSRLRLAVSAVLGVALVAVFGALLSSADAVFSSVVRRLLPSLSPESVTRFVIFFVLGLTLTLGLAYLRLSPPRLASRDGPRRVVRLAEWVLPLTLLNGLFLLFVGVQVTVLFGGASLVQQTANLTYANYARGGFWQLSVVTMLTLLVIRVAARRAPRESTVERVWLRAMLGGLCVLTLVIVASAMHRMWTYEQAYGFTHLRLLVSACEIWLGIVFLLVLVAGVRLRAAWMARAMALTAVATLLGLGALDPDGFIAAHNVDRWRDSGRIDLPYLSSLSPDAVPALDALPEPQRSCALWPIARDLADLGGDPWAGWNLGRDRAREILARVSEPPPGTCS